MGVLDSKVADTITKGIQSLAQVGGVRFNPQLTRQAFLS
jgi:hypothetical protein